MLEVIAQVKQPIDWIQILISVSSIVTSIIAIIISVTTYRSQARHNRNSVRPILNIIFGDYEEDLYIRIDNNGVGPAIIKNVSCSNGYNEKNCLVDFIPKEVSITTPSIVQIVPMFPLTDFVEDISGRAIAPEKHIVLLELSTPGSERRLALRSVLKELKIHVEYTDVYGKETFVVERELSFFGRTLYNIQAKVAY